MHFVVSERIEKTRSSIGEIPERDGEWPKINAKQK